MTHAHTHDSTHTHTHAGNDPAEGPAHSGGDGGRAPDPAVAVTTDGLPDWLDPVARAARSVQPQQLSRFLPPESGAAYSRPSWSCSARGSAGPSCC